ncbi:MAG: hypothetical protein HEP71_16285 [Roseivirga sp.]|nr:hypothetical protein [Roseivirga sp.]
MRKSKFRISSGFKLAILAIIFMTLYACQTVYTANPLPSAGAAEATAFPKLIAGDYLIVEEGMNGSDREPGNQYVRITLIDEQHCVVETYSGFDMEQLASHRNAERFRVTGDYLIYKNDSLIQELAEIKARVEASPENEEYQKELERLKHLENNGYLNQITPLTKRGHLLTYNREPALEIDLLEQEAIAFDGQNLVETGNPKIRIHNERLFLNHSDSEHGWENIIVELSDEGLKGFNISFKHVLKHKAQYEKTAKLNQPDANAIIIDPSVTELDKMLREEGFLANQVTLERVDLEEEAKGKPAWWLVLLGALLVVVVLRAMRRSQPQT